MTASPPSRRAPAAPLSPRFVATLLATLLALTLLASACAFSDALSRGDRHAATGDWSRAIDAYSEAVQYDPDSPAARRKLEDARSRAAAHELAAGRDALSARQHREAFEHVQRARNIVPGLPETADLEASIADDLIALCAGYLDQGELARARVALTDALELFPRDERVSAATGRLRKLVLEEAERLGASGHFERAIAELDALGKADPAQRRHTDPVRADLQSRWAASVRERAQRAERAGHLGSAYLLYDHAASIAAVPDDVRRRDTLRHKLAGQGELAVHLEVKGDRGRALTLSEGLRRYLLNRAGASVTGRARAADMALSIELEPALCREQSITEVGVARYLASTRQVDNPEHARRRRELLAAQRHLADHEARELDFIEGLARLEQQFDRAWTHDHERIDREVQRAEDDLSGAIKALEREESEFDSLQQRLDDARANDDRGGGGGANNHSAIQQELQSQRAKVKQARKKVRRARKALHHHLNALANVRQALGRLQADIDACRGDVIAARKEVIAERRHVHRAHERLLDVPSLIAEEVWADYRYPIQRVTRTCTAEATVEFRPDGAPGRVQKLSVSASTQDSSHAAHVRYGVRQDPLRFPRTDAELIAELDANLLARGQAATSDALERQQSDLLAKADRLLGRDRPRAITLYVIHILSGSNARRDEVHRFLAQELERL